MKNIPSEKVELQTQLTKKEVEEILIKALN